MNCNHCGTILIGPYIALYCPKCNAGNTKSSNSTPTIRANLDEICEKAYSEIWFLGEKQEDINTIKQACLTAIAANESKWKAEYDKLFSDASYCNFSKQQLDDQRVCAVQSRDKWKKVAGELVTAKHNHGLVMNEEQRLTCPRCQALAAYAQLLKEEG